MLRFIRPVKPAVKPTVGKQKIPPLRRPLVVQIVLASLELTVFVFLITAVYLGCGYNPQKYARNLDVVIVDFDQDAAGQIFLDSFQQAKSENLTLNWRFKSPRDYRDEFDGVRQTSQRGEVWATVVLRSNTTRRTNHVLHQLMTDSAADIDGFIFEKPPILVTYEEGRNMFTMNNYVLPPIRAAIARASAQYGRRLRQTLLNKFSSSSSTNLTAQLNNLMRLNSLLVDPLVAQFDNHHPASPFVGRFSIHPMVDLLYHSGHLASTMGYVCLYIFLNAALFVGSTVQFVSLLGQPSFGTARG